MANSIFDKIKATICKNSSHIWGDWNIDKDVCSESHTCQRCGAVETRPTEHRWGEWEYLEKQCLQECFCTHCGARQERSVEHDWGQVHRNQRCRDSKVCRRCSKEVELTVSGHVWSEWTNTPEHNCGNGSKERECRSCHTKETSQNSQHTWGNWEHITEHCLNERKCLICGKQEAKVEHAWGEWVTDGKCTLTWRCGPCGTTEMKEKHTWGNQHFGDQSGCFTKCDICGETFKQNHDKEEISVKFLSSTKMGSGDDYWDTNEREYRCKRCGFNWKEIGW